MRNSPSAVAIMITDDGIGIGNQNKKGGFGLGIMKYRASSIGADLQITARKPSGTCVRLTLKLQKDMSR